MTEPKQVQQRDVIGLLPAGGQATRIAPLPLSKELYPVGFRAVDATGSPRPKVVCHYLLEKMRSAGITKAYMILRAGKWDIPAYFGDGALVDMSLGYLMMRSPHGVPYTLNQAYPFIQDAFIALGFPDILFQPDDAYTRLLTRHATSNADVVLGLLPTNQPTKAGMVDFDAAGRVHLIIEKPPITHLLYMWGMAVWTPAFTEFMHTYLAMIDAQHTSDPSLLRRELPIGDVIQAAIANGMHVQAEVFEHGSYLDIGTPDDLLRAVQEFSGTEKSGKG